MKAQASFSFTVKTPGTRQEYIDRVNELGFGGLPIDTLITIKDEDGKVLDRWVLGTDKPFEPEPDDGTMLHSLKLREETVQCRWATIYVRAPKDASKEDLRQHALRVVKDGKDDRGDFFDFEEDDSSCQGRSDPLGTYIEFIGGDEVNIDLNEECSDE